MVPECIKGFLQVFDVVGSVEAFDYHIINIGLHISPKLPFEDPVDQPLESGTGILQAEGHHLVTIQTFVGDKGRLLLILRIHSNLVVAGESIHETQQLVAGSSVDQLINLREREAIFWASLVEVCIVDADPPLAASFLHHYHIGQPLGIAGLSDEPCLEELANLFVYSLLSFWGEAPLLLPHRLVPRGYFQPMSNYFGGNS